MNADDIELGQLEGEVIAEVAEGEGSYSAPTKAADHRYAVLYQSDFQSPNDGTSIAARSHARALADCGVPVMLKSISTKVVKGGVVEELHTTGYDEKIVEQVGDLMDMSASSLVPLIRHLVVHSAEQLGRLIMKGAISPTDTLENIKKARDAIYGQTILMSVWERDLIDDETLSHMKRVAMNWVPSENNAQILRDLGVENVEVVHHPFNFDDPICHLTKRLPVDFGSFDLKHKRFYTIGRWEPRKGHLETIDAFLELYRNDERAHLTIKTHEVGWKGFPTIEEYTAQMCEKYRISTEQFAESVSIIDRPVNRNGIVRLHFENNIYVCNSRGEAFCLPAFEAKVAGNRMVYCPWGGQSEFADAEDVFLSYKMEEVPATYRWPQGSKWAVTKMQSLVDELRTVEPPDRFRRPACLDNYTATAVGEKMKSSVKKVIEGLEFADSESILKEMKL